MVKKFKRAKLKIHSADKAIVITIFILLGFGLMILSSASLEIARKNFNSPYHYFFHQLIYGVGIGLVFFFIAQKIHYTFWKKCALLILIFSIGALALVFIPGLGFKYSGAKRWLGWGSFSIQPSE